ncbi:MAG: hypothetical protein IIX19_00730 [Alistipes sp.]|nr:hypothetical protein [Alistipes sp.]
MNYTKFLLTIVALFISISVYADYPERGQMAKSKGRKMTVKEWKTTPDGKNKWVDHVEVYNAKGQLIEEIEYGDYGRHMSWRSEYFYNAKGQLEKEIVYNERNKPSKVRKFEYDSNGVCIRRLNYGANGILNSYRQFEYSYE